MLIEMFSPAFKELDKERNHIQFHEGLNVILGTEEATNSIGKSTALLAIDFVFGGDTYILKGNVVDHVGDHVIYFAFKFDSVVYRFARDTGNSGYISVCDDSYSVTGEIWDKYEYTTWLKEKYKLDFPGLSFRTAMSSFFRIYKKGNTDELNPLRGIPMQGMEKSIKSLVKLYDKYYIIQSCEEQIEAEKDRLNVLKKARDYRFVSNAVNTIEQYEENLNEIKNLQLELDILSEDQAEGKLECDIEKSQQKDALVVQKLNYETAVQAKQRRLKLIDLSLSYGLTPNEAELLDLQEFFPDVNLRKIFEIENYHKKLSQILQSQFLKEKDSLLKEIEELHEQIAGIESQISDLGIVANISKEFLDKHTELQGKINLLTDQNEAYLLLNEITQAKSKANNDLNRCTNEVLGSIEGEIDSKMAEFDYFIFHDSRKPPYLHFNSFKSYTFETPNDDGTGTSYKGMILYDLAVLSTSALPAISHDSLLFKNLGDQVIDGVIKLYSGFNKQIFIAFDKQKAFSDETFKILDDNTVLRLGDNGSQLFGCGWNE